MIMRKKQVQKTTRTNKEITHEEILKYTPLVKSIAKYFLYITNSCYDFEDLVQEGYIGLCIAAKKWNPSFNVTLGAYAKTYIFGRIYRSLTKSMNYNYVNINPIDDNTIDPSSDFSFELYDFIESMYDEEDCKVLKLVFGNYKKKEILKTCKITSDYYEELIDDFKKIFE